MDQEVLAPKQPRYGSQYTEITSNENFLRVLNTYNLYYEGQHEKLIVNQTSSQLFIDGILKIHWGLSRPIHLKREEPTWKRKSMLLAFENGLGEEELMMALGETSRSRRVDDLTEVDGDAGWNKIPPNLRPTIQGSESTVTLLDPLSQGQVEWMGPRKSLSNGQATPSPTEDGTLGQIPLRGQVSMGSPGLEKMGYSPEKEGAGSLETVREEVRIRRQGASLGLKGQGQGGGVKRRRNLERRGSGETAGGPVLDPSSDPLCEGLPPAGLGVVRRAQTFREPQRTRQVTVGRHRSFHDKRFLQQDALKRRASFGGHLYKQKTRVFTPQFGTLTTLRAESTMTTPQIIAMLLKKFAVENNPDEFSLFTVRENGETHRLKDGDYPLLVRVLQGPGEDVAKIFIMENSYDLDISHEVAQYINLELPILNGILEKFQEEEEREVQKIKEKYNFYKRLLEAKLDKISTQV